MAALPYSWQWVGLDGAPPPNTNKWHMYWDGNEQTLCGLYVEEEGPITAARFNNMMSKMDRQNTCPVCCEKFRRIVYWRIEHGESVEDLRA